MKAKVQKSNSTPDVRKRISETLKKKWQDPEFRQYMLDKMATRNSNKNTQHSLSHRQKISDSMKRKWREDEHYRNKAINGMTKVRGTVSRADANRKISQTMKLKWQDEHYRALMIKKNANSTVARTKRAAANKAPPKRKATVTKAVKRTRAKATKVTKIKSKEMTIPSHQEVIIPPTTAKSLGIDVQEDQRRVTKLRQERRDLYDLLYGDDDEDMDDDFFNDDDQQVQLQDAWAVAKQ